MLAIAIATAALAGPALPLQESDFSTLAAVHAENVVKPVDTCTTSRLVAYSPKQEELGSWSNALRLVDESSRACGLAGARAELARRLRAQAPAASAFEISRRTDVGFAYGAVVALRIVASKFKLSLSPNEIAVPPLKSGSIRRP